jgi:alcohol dehydrogenase class IV
MSDGIRFQFNVPTDIRFGRGVVATLPELPQVAGKRCMLLTFPGFSNPVIGSLERACATLVHPDRFEENPSYGLSTELAGIIIDQNIDAVIAIGGGSSMDSVKAAVWLAANPGWDATAPGDSPVIPTLPIIAVPTTAGTGSEVSPFAVYTEDDTGAKRFFNHTSLNPTVALCDPELTVTMPRSVTANTGIDAASHAIEAYLSVKCQGYMEEMALSACEATTVWLPLALEDGSDVDAREGMMHAALLGGFVLAACGTVVVHAMGYQITKDFHYPHGLANAVLLPGFIDLLADRGVERALAIRDAFGGDLGEFISSCGLDRKLPADEIDDAMMERWIDAGYTAYGRVNCVAPLDRDDIRAILESSICRTV